MLESDGTEIDDSEVLLELKNETLVLLQPNEEWISSYSICTTDTVTSGASSISIDPLPVILDIDSIPMVDTINTEQKENANPDDKKNKVNSEYSWNRYEIPWNKIPEHMIKQCEDGDRNKKTIIEIVHIVINDVRQIREMIPLKGQTKGRTK